MNSLEATGGTALGPNFGQKFVGLLAKVCQNLGRLPPGKLGNLLAKISDPSVFPRHDRRPGRSADGSKRRRRRHC